MSDATHPKIKAGLIFLALFALTVIEVFAADLPFAVWIVALTLIVLALFKAALVAFFYMHLKFEKMLLLVIAFAPLIFSVVMVLLVGADMKAADSLNPAK